MFCFDSPPRLARKGLIISGILSQFRHNGFCRVVPDTSTITTFELYIDLLRYNDVAIRKAGYSRRGFAEKADPVHPGKTAAERIR
jgi:hypothetical protein